MKRLYLLSFSVMLAAFLSQCTTQKKEQINDASEAEKPKFKLERGVNISHWLSQSKRRGEERRSFIAKKDLDFIAQIGYDHVRIPIDEEQMWNEKGGKEAEAFELLHNGISWALENKLKVIVDLHILRSHHFNEDEKPLWTDPAAQEQFFQCWRDLSGELNKYPTTEVAYELMNEPVADDPEEWNVLVGNAAKAVRELEPERFIVIGSNLWQSVHTFDDLKVPGNDPYIILSFHFYHPFLLTHHQASWTDIGDYTGPVGYPGLLVETNDLEAIESSELKAEIERRNGVYTIDSLELMMAKPIKKAKELDLQLYCGEWGCYPTVEREDMLQWYADMRVVLERNGIAWTNWDYRGGFGIATREDGAPIDDLIEVLLK